MSFWSEQYDKLLKAKNAEELEKIFVYVNDEILKDTSVEEDEEGQARFVAFYETLKKNFNKE